MMDDEQLRQILIEDLGTVDGVDELLPLVTDLRNASTPQPTAQETSQLLATLKPTISPQQVPATALWRERLQWVYWLLRAQMRVVHNEIWLGSAFVMTLGVLVTLAVDLHALPFVLIAPMVAAVGITFLYAPSENPALEIELATAVSPRLILLARMALLFGIDLGLGIVGSLLLAAIRSDISLGPLLNTWLAPMTFLSTFAFFFSLISFEPLLGVVLTLILWGIQTMRQFDFLFRLSPVIPNLLLPQWQPWLWLGTVLLGGTAVWLAGREEWMIKSGSPV